jgi:hypothetical protein
MFSHLHGARAKSYRQHMGELVAMNPETEVALKKAPIDERQALTVSFVRKTYSCSESMLSTEFGTGLACLEDSEGYCLNLYAC